MDPTIAAILTLDGVGNGAIYALLALATVLLFAVTRVIFIPQGEFVAFGALTFAMLQQGNPIGSLWQRYGDLPGTLWLLAVTALIAAAIDTTRALQQGQPARAWREAATTLALPLLLVLVCAFAQPRSWPMAAQVLLTLAIVTPLGPLVYRLAYQRLADASVLVLLIVSVGVHFALTGLGLLFFGAEAFRNPPFWDARFSIGPLTLSGQAIIILGCSAALIVLLWLFFERTLRGKALRATAVNRTGARLMGISPASAGRLSFTMAAFMGALSGLLIGPSTSVYYDSGFLIGLKGFVAAVFAGLASYPLAALGALGVGVIESFASYGASAFKEVIVFTTILPILLWRSLRDPHHEDD
jgi:branched-chain amino acid transport system permease protein